jgi:CheY-like chemotaxis protein
VRRLCECKTPKPDGTAEPRGCERCRFSGFAGRVGVYELMRLTPRVRSVVVARGPDDLLRSAARAAGMASMTQDGTAKAAAGRTTAAEVRRAVPPDDLSEDGQELPAPGTRVPEALSVDVATPRRARILVVDDDPAMVEVLRDILVAENYDVASARDGQEALAELYRHRPDLVLTDLQMPRLDGLGLLHKVRGDLATCQIPVVFLTVVDSPDREAEALDLGADDYISKPVQRARLLGRVRRALFRSHLLQTAR